MKQGTLIKYINKVLQSTWSSKEVKEGKIIVCMPGWVKTAKEVSSLYEEEGWIVEIGVSITSKERSYFMKVKHPSWSLK
mgnify:CR=1 FL=1